MSADRTDGSFSEDEARTLAGVLNEIIPPSADGQRPGAGAIGLVSDVEQALRRTPELRPMIVQGLVDLEAAARARHGRSFITLAKADKVALLNEQGFLFPLLFHVYVGYYQNPTVVRSLGLDPRPPHPAGHAMEPNDLTLLDAVRRRPKMYREV